jgi:hypothetical protein
MMTVTLTTDSGSIFYDVLPEDVDKVTAKIERLMSGFIVDRKEVR